MTIFNRLAFFIFIFSIIFNNISLSANEKKRIAVFNFDAKNAPKSYADIARDTLEINLHKSAAFVVLERSMIDLILKEQGLQMSGCTDTSCLVQVGKLLSADLVVVGSLSKIKTYTLSVKMVDISKGSIILAETEKAATEDDIEDAVKQIAGRLSGNVANRKEVIITDKGKDEKPLIKSEPSTRKGTYGFLSISFIVISAGLAGTGYYFDTKLKSTISDYNSLADRYHTTTDPNEAASLQNSMTSKKEDADKYEKTRNILYGAGIGTTILAVFFIYKYFTSKPVELASSGSNYMPVIPLIYTSGFNGYNQNKQENFYGAGLLIRF
ncbi:MAG: CsgG/HfaB family protein [Spirochaetota bacterium]